MVNLPMKTEGKKLDTGKAPVLRGLLAYFPNALEVVANVSAYGAKKYGLDYSDKNWAKVLDGLGRYGDALARHTTRHAGGESHDPESNLLHIAHAAWNALAVLELTLQNNSLEPSKTNFWEERRIGQRRKKQLLSYCAKSSRRLLQERRKAA